MKDRARYTDRKGLFQRPVGWFVVGVLLFPVAVVTLASLGFPSASVRELPILEALNLRVAVGCLVAALFGRGALTGGIVSFGALAALKLDLARTLPRADADSMFVLLEAAVSAASGALVGWIVYSGIRRALRRAASVPGEVSSAG